MMPENEISRASEVAAEKSSGVDYDSIAGQYDRRYQGRDLQPVRELIRNVRGRVRGRALEVGCGTGHWLPLLSDEAAGEAVGLDRSLGMLNAARGKRPAQPLCQGDAAALPFDSSLMGLTVCVNALHHFSAPCGFLREAVRVTRAGGLVLIVGLDAHDPEAEWYIYDFFDDVRSMDRDRYPRWGDVRDWSRAAGMSELEFGVAHTVHVELHGEEVFTDRFLSRQGTSQLALLSEEEYALGLERVRRQVERGEADGGPARFRTRLDLRYLLANIGG